VTVVRRYRVPWMNWVHQKESMWAAEQRVNRCMNDAAPAQHVVWEEDPAAVSRLLSSMPEQYTGITRAHLDPSSPFPQDHPAAAAVRPPACSTVGWSRRRCP